MYFILIIEKKRFNMAKIILRRKMRVMERKGDNYKHQLDVIALKRLEGKEKHGIPRAKHGEATTMRFTQRIGTDNEPCLFINFSCTCGNPRTVKCHCAQPYFDVYKDKIKSKYD